MNKKSLLLLVSLLGIAAIPQLLYFWLAPEAVCGNFVYWFGTVFIVLHLGLSYLLWQTYDTRRVAAFVLVGSSILLCTLVVGALFLAIGAAVRTAVYALAVIAVLYVVCSGLLIAPLLAEPAEHGSTARDYIPYVPQYNCESQQAEEEEPYAQNRVFMPVSQRETAPTPRSSTPLTRETAPLPRAAAPLTRETRETRETTPLPRPRVSNPPPLPEKR
ncbi:MAG: hypothetical protein ABFC31_09320 [Clostridiaceae bacterium]